MMCRIFYSLRCTSDLPVLLDLCCSEYMLFCRHICVLFSFLHAFVGLSPTNEFAIYRFYNFFIKDRRYSAGLQRVYQIVYSIVYLIASQCILIHFNNCFKRQWDLSSTPNYLNTKIKKKKNTLWHELSQPLIS